MSAKSLGENDPSLRLREDSAVLFFTLVVDNHEGSVEGVFVIWRIHQHYAVLGVEDIVNAVQRLVRLLIGCKTTDDRPALRVQPHVCLRIGSLSDGLSVLCKSTDETILVPAVLLKDLCQLVRVFFQILHILCVISVCGIFSENLHCKIELEGNEGGLSVCSETETIVPVCVKTCRHSVISQMIHGEINGHLQVLINRCLSLVRVRNHLIEEGCISGLSDVFVYRREKPERVICSVGRMSCLLYIGSIVRCILMSRIVCELNKRKSAAVVYLGGEHETDLLHSHFRSEMDDTLNILYGVAVSVTVPESAVNEGSCPGPGESHKAVVCVPCIDHGVEFRARSLHVKMCKFSVPVVDELRKLLFYLLLRISLVASHNLSCLLVTLHSEDEGKILTLAGLKGNNSRKCTAAVLVVVQLISKIAALNSYRISVVVVSSKEFLLVTTVGSNLSACHSKESVFCNGTVCLVFSRLILIDGLTDTVTHEMSLCDKQCVLKVYLILLIIAVVCKLGETGHSQVSRTIRCICNLQVPYLIGTVQRYIVVRLGMNAAVISKHLCVCCSMVTLTFICVQRFSDRLPGC